jgi:ribosomal-protein-alanine N-acetyltransferase
VFSLEPLGPDHEAAVLAFERDNRAYFARSVTDRGDAFYQHYPDRHQELLAEQEVGTGAFYVLVDGRGDVVGRFNLYGIRNGMASVGYRIAEHVTGRGVATSGLDRLCRLAQEEIGLRRLTATADNANVASQRVLAKAGFVRVGPAEVAGRDGSEFTLDLAPQQGRSGDP